MVRWECVCTAIGNGRVSTHTVDFGNPSLIGERARLLFSASAAMVVAAACARANLCTPSLEPICVTPTVAAGKNDEGSCGRWWLIFACIVQPRAVLPVSTVYGDARLCVFPRNYIRPCVILILHTQTHEIVWAFFEATMGLVRLLIGRPFSAFDAN